MNPNMQMCIFPENKSCDKFMQINAIEHKRFLLMSKDLFFNFFVTVLLQATTPGIVRVTRNTRIDLVG